MAAKKRIFLGLYSGRAADGIDAALVSMGDQGEALLLPVEQIQHVEKLYPQSIRQQILEVTGGKALPANLLSQLDRNIGIAAAATAQIALESANLQPDDIEAVGFSGQPVGFEQAGKTNGLGSLLELGSAAIIAGRINKPTVSNFMAGDLAAGGCGGPVTAWADWLLFRDERLSRVMVHLGGIATITFIPTDADLVDVVSYDVGPGTAVVDELVFKYHHHLYDTDGTIAAGGKVLPALLNELMANPYFAQKYPKQTSLLNWSQKYLWQLLQMAQKHDCSGADLITTVTELTARTIVQAVADFTERPHEVILTGGGAMNIHLAGRIRTLLSPCSTYTVEKYHYGIRAKQAICYALLAAGRLDNFATNCPATTAARRNVSLGAVTMP